MYVHVWRSEGSFRSLHLLLLTSLHVRSGGRTWDVTVGAKPLDLLSYLADTKLLSNVWKDILCGMLAIEIGNMGKKQPE